MRYHYDYSKIPTKNTAYYGVTYKCDHPVYDKCTLYLVKDRGLAVIQQRYYAKTKSTYWTQIDTELVDALYLNEGFLAYFNSKAGTPNEKKLYPTVTVRQLMWALKLKPLQRQPWETTFDKSGF